MNLSVFSFIMSMLWFSAFLVICNSVRRKTGFIKHYGLLPLLLLISVSLFRLVNPIEVPNVFVIRSQGVLPMIHKAFFGDLFSIGVIPVSVMGCLAVVWIAGAVYLLFRFFRKEWYDHGYMGLLDVMTDERIQAKMDEIVKQSKSKRRYKIVASPELDTPLTTGYFHPVIHIPEKLLELDDINLEYILRHEWCHIVSRDLWVRWLVEVLSKILWWHPPMQTFKVGLEQALEINCDLRVIRSMRGLSENQQIAEYIETLMLYAQGCADDEEEKTPTGAGMYFAKQKESFIVQRCEVIAANPKPSLLTNIVVCIVIFSMLVLSYAFIFQSYILPDDVEVDGWYEVTNDIKVDSYLIEIENGVYHLYMNDKYVEEVEASELKYPPINRVQIIEKKERSEVP